MFLPDWNFFAQLCGASSLNAVILPQEIRLPQSQGGNEALHKDLRRFNAEEDLSRKGYVRLINTLVEHSNEQGEGLNADSIGRLWAMVEVILSDESGQVLHISDMRKNLLASLPESLPPKTRDHLCELLVSSLLMKTRIEKEGPNALIRKLEEADDPAWGPFYAEMVRRLKGANEVSADVSAALQIMGGLSLLLTFWIEAIEREAETPAELKQSVKDNIKFLFAVENDQVYPQKAVAGLLRHALDHSGCNTKIDFIRKEFGESNTRIREAHKFFAGTEIPTFEQTQTAFRASSLSNQDKPEADDIPIIIVQFIARSYRHLNERLKKPLSDELKPHAIIFNHLNSAMQAHAKAGPAATGLFDQSTKEEEVLS